MPLLNKFGYMYFLKIIQIDRNIFSPFINNKTPSAVLDGFFISLILESQHHETILDNVRCWAPDKKKLLCCRKRT
jgi:hypothetical protein